MVFANVSMLAAQQIELSMGAIKRHIMLKDDSNR